MQNDANKYDRLADQTAAVADELTSTRLKDLREDEIEQVSGGVFSDNEFYS